MKLLYIVAKYGVVSETFVTDLISGLKTGGIDLQVMANQVAGNCPPHVRQLSYVQPASLAERLNFRMPWTNPDAVPELRWRREIARSNRAFRAGLDGVEADLAYVDFGNICAMVQRALVEKGIPFVVHFHGADISSGLNSGGYREDLRFCFRHARGILCASDHIRRLLVLAGADPDRIRLIRYGHDLEGVTPMSWADRRKGHPAVVFLGRLTPKKHPVALVEAFAIARRQVPGARLTLIGDGPERPAVAERIERLKIGDCVELAGSMTRQEAMKIVNRHWIYAQHSVTAHTGDQEGFGISLVEAAALGLPVVSTWHNGIPESVIDGTTGLLSREYNYEEMGEQLASLLADGQRCEQMGLAGQARVEAEFPTANRIEAMKEYLGSLVTG